MPDTIEAIEEQYEPARADEKQTPDLATHETVGCGPSPTQ